MATRQRKNRKVAILGLEKITATEIYSLFVSGRISEVVLVGTGGRQLIREFRELNSMVPLSTTVTLDRGDIADCLDAEIAVIGGSADAGGGTLVDLRKGIEGVRQTVASLFAAGFPGIILVTGSPIEVLVRAAAEAAGIPSEKVVGIGNRTDLGAVVSRTASCRTLPAAERPAPTELPKGWCTAASSEVRYVDSCTPNCPYFESLAARPGVSSPFAEEGRRRTPQNLAACVTQVCESVIDDMHTAVPVFVYDDGRVMLQMRMITRDGLANRSNDPEEILPPQDEAANTIWSMVNADRSVQARST